MTDSLFLPFVYAPINNKVAVLKPTENKEYQLLNPRFPYLKKIDGYAIEDFLKKIRPQDIRAPRDAFFSHAVSDINAIEKNYKLLGKPLPKQIQLTLTNAELKKDTVLLVNVVDRSKGADSWVDKFKKDFNGIRKQVYNNPQDIKQFFQLNDGVAYIRIPEMRKEKETPLLFENINSFMNQIKDNSNALIIDVRSNGGGTREILYEFAKYLVHSDSIFVINATKQRAPIPLPESYRNRLKARFLTRFSDLDLPEQKKVSEFMKTFNPVYQLDPKKYSEYYFGILNGSKLEKPAYFYNKPVYIFANEYTFSAASVFVSVLKGLPNIKIVGVTTDGSSGNSEVFNLPNSKLAIKLSTMVSFQKDGSILDGYGTAPDIIIERAEDHILCKRDTQLDQLKANILDKK